MTIFRCGIKIERSDRTMPRHTRKHNSKSHKAKKRNGTKKAGPSDWNKKVMEVYRELKKKNPATKLGDAMRAAKRA